MKKLLIAAMSFLLLTPASALADEGMWLLPFLNKNIKDMRKAGFKLSPEDIYSINKSSLKDAIVIFGGGCTGEVISPEGLLLTNHHCGYGTIQEHSSVEHDYLKDGFWAANYEQEIPSPGLAVTFVRGIEDVTSKVLAGVTEDMSQEERSAKIGEVVEMLSNENNRPEDNISVRVVPMFGGNQYLMFTYERFGDVRLVGTPPSSIGKFGGEQDNWMWPRHTGDFSMFRIYSTPEGKSTANYSAENVPYKAPRHLTISTKGVKAGDYTMIMGFPGSTNRYMTTWEVEKLLHQENPIRIYMRGEKQKVWWADMMASDAVRIKYANKYAGSSNYWKNSIGMSRGLKRLDVKGTKQADQDKFMAWVNESPERVEKYGDALQLIEESVAEGIAADRIAQVIQESISGIESYRFALTVRSILDSELSDEQKREYLKGAAADYFKDYNAPTDKKASLVMFKIMADSLPQDKVPSFLNFSFGGNFEENFDVTPYTNEERFAAAVEGDLNLLKEDATYQNAVSLLAPIYEAYDVLDASESKFAEGHRKYLAGLLEMNKGKKNMYPDANFTIRMTYGNVLPYKAADAVDYDYYTTLSGVMAKEDPNDPEFVVPAKLRELYEAKDFGRWGKDDIVTCFISDNDITGGNSGSPVLNGRGELVGLAFDGNWEAMSGDVAFEPNVQRTISMDIRYVLFIIDKFAGAQRLIDEMTIK